MSDLTSDDNGVLVSPGVRIYKPDLNNWTIERRTKRKSKDGVESEIWSVVGFYPSMEMAATTLMTRHVDLLVGDTHQDVQALVHAVEKAKREIIKACRSHTP